MLTASRNTAANTSFATTAGQTNSLHISSRSAIQTFQAVESYFSCTHRAILFVHLALWISVRATTTRSLLNKQSIFSLWCDPCLRQRHDAILTARELYAHEIYAQAEHQRWSSPSIEQAIRICYQQLDREIQSFSAAVEEAESRASIL